MNQKYYIIFHVWKKTDDLVWTYKQAFYHKHPLQWLLTIRDLMADEEFHILSYNELDKDDWLYFKDQFDDFYL